MNVSGSKRTILKRTFWLLVAILISAQAAGGPLLAIAKPSARQNASKTKASRAKGTADPITEAGVDQVTKVASAAAIRRLR